MTILYNNDKNDDNDVNRNISGFSRYIHIKTEHSPIR